MRTTVFTNSLVYIAFDQSRLAFRTHDSAFGDTMLAGEKYRVVFEITVKLTCLL